MQCVYDSNVYISSYVTNTVDPKLLWRCYRKTSDSDNDRTLLNSRVCGVLISREQLRYVISRNRRGRRITRVWFHAPLPVWIIYVVNRAICFSWLLRKNAYLITKIWRGSLHVKVYPLANDENGNIYVVLFWRVQNWPSLVFLKISIRNLNSILEYLSIFSRSIQGYPIDRICII